MNNVYQFRESSISEKVVKCMPPLNKNNTKVFLSCVIQGVFCRGVRAVRMINDQLSRIDIECIISVSFLSLPLPLKTAGNDAFFFFTCQLVDDPVSVVIFLVYLYLWKLQENFLFHRNHPYLFLTFPSQFFYLFIFYFFDCAHKLTYMYICILYE